MYLELLEAKEKRIETYTSIAESSNESAKCAPEKKVLSKEKQNQKLTNIIQKPKSVDRGNHPHSAYEHYKKHGHTKDECCRVPKYIFIMQVKFMQMS